MSFGPTRSTPRATRPRPAVARRHRDDGAQGAPANRSRRSNGRSRRRAQDAHLRPPPLAWAQRHRADRAVQAAATLSGRLVDADGAGLAGRTLRVVARPSRGASRPGPGRGVADRAARWLSAVGFRPGPRAGSRSPSRAMRTSRRRRAEPADAAGARRHRFEGVLLAVLQHRRGGALQRPRPHPWRAAATARASWSAIQYFEQARNAGARCWSPAATTAATSTPAIASATSAARPAFASARCALAEERWPYAPGASRPLDRSRNRVG